MKTTRGMCGVLCLALAVIGAQGCGGSKCADGSCDGASKDFQLQTCATDGDCLAGSTCLLEKCDTACVPDPDGRCLPCPEAGGGLCLPPPADGGPAPVAPECFAGRLGDPAACDIDADWAARAIEACAARGADLIDLHALLTCPDGRPSGAVFTCCSFGAGPVDPPPPPVAGECVELPFPGGPADGSMPDPKEMAYQQCRSMGMDLQDLRPMDPGPDGAPMTWLAVCCGGVIEPPPPAETCIEIPVKSDPASSDPMFADPKMAAHQQCLDMGLELRDLRPDAGDSAGNVYVWFASCCGPEAQPPEPPTPPDPGSCVQVPVKVDPSNPDPMASDPKWFAHQQCQSMGMDLRDLQPMAPDASGFSPEWMATCCGGATEPPPAETCIEIPVKSDPASSDPMFADPKMAAHQQCLDMGLELRDLRPDAGDSAGNVYVWFASCCGPEAQPPEPPTPPDPEACTVVPVGDGTCRTNVDFKGLAHERCREIGATLQDLTIRSTCADGSIGAVLATCCR